MFNYILFLDLKEYFHVVLRALIVVVVMNSEQEWKWEDDEKEDKDEDGYQTY